MIILAVDTTGKSCSVAVVSGGALRAEVTLVRDETHSRHLHSLIEYVLTAAEIDLAMVEGFAVTRGPGSFTGSRIGLSTVKGLAYAARRPLVGLSSLEILARQAGAVSQQICPMIDARRHQVYASGYRFENDRLICNREESVSAPEALIDQIPTPCIFIGSGAHLYRRWIVDRLGRRAVIPPAPDHVIRATTIAHTAMNRLATFDITELGRLTPSYVRPSDAELKH